MSCFGGGDEQIYLVEVFVDKLKMTEGGMKDVGEGAIAIRMKFLEFLAIEITREDFDSIRPAPAAAGGGTTLGFSVGRSCLFIKRPIDLVRDLRSSPAMPLGVYRPGDTYPAAETELTIPACLCDQIAMSSNQRENRPKAVSVKGGFHLLDPGDNYAGTLDMELRLTCLGRSILTHYELRAKFLLFKNQDAEEEFAVRRLVPVRYCDVRTEDDPRPKCGEGALPEFFEESEKAPADTDVHVEYRKGKGIKKLKRKQKKKGEKKGRKKGKKRSGK